MSDLPFSPFPPPGTHAELEEGTRFTPRFDADGLIPAAVTDAKTGELVMHAWMNAEALARTIETGEAWYWSRSRGELWHKGATSGQIQHVIAILTDCDQDTIWLKVEVAGNGASCHVGYHSCFYREITRTADGTVGLTFSGKEKVYDPAEIYGHPHKHD
ncbi:MAG: phosphoribosyl-AMP cyclohydrolase [Parvibaculaceae bacterium]|nr:phosphoribosyl-AMP cyclohydrolase [Parvibaculaceae bacterium]